MIDFLAFAAIISLLVFIGLFKSRKVESESGYLFAERQCSTWQLMCTLVMTEINTSTLLSFAGLGYLAGIRALSLPFAFLAGLLFYAITVAKKWKELDASSVAHLFRKRYGKTLAKLASFSLILSMLGFSATYVKSLSLLFSPLFPAISPWLLTAFFIFITLAMTLRGGLAAIIRTDIFSFILMCIILPLLFYFSFKKSPEISFVFQNAEQILSTRFIISVTILTMFTYILAPWYAHKIFSARNKRVARRAVIFAAILIFIFYGVAALATACLKMAGVSLRSYEEGLPYILQNLLPSGLRGISFAVFFAICSTTLAGVWSAMSSMALADFGKADSHASYRRGLILTLFFAALSYFLGNALVDRILDRLILANIPTAALSFSLLAGFYWKKASPFGALLSIIVGMCWGAGCYLYYGEEGLYTWHWAVYGIPLIFASGILGSYIKPLKPLKTARYLL